jgi:hypothetical protein
MTRSSSIESGGTALSLVIWLGPADYIRPDDSTTPSTTMSTSTARVTRSKRKRDEEALLPPPAVPVPAVPQYEELPPPKAKRARKAPIKKASGKVFEDTAEGSSSGAGGSGEDVRLAKYKPKCPQVTQERIARVMSQR